MKKLVSLAFLSITLLQSCTQDELAVTPKQVGVTPAGVAVENAAVDISKYVTNGAKAILLKPFDNNSNTNLTTLFYADNNGNITPIVPNFEVRQVEVTKKGVYVKTNYSEGGEFITFFVDYDQKWTQLKGVGDYVGLMGDDVLFSDGSVFKPSTAKIEKKNLSAVSKSENLVLVKSGSSGSVYNVVTGVGFPILYDERVNKIISLRSDRVVAVLHDNSWIEVVSMINGNPGNGIDPTMIDNPSDMVRNPDGVSITALGWEYPGKWNGNTDEDGEADGIKQITVGINFEVDGNGDVEASWRGSDRWNGKPLTPYTESQEVMTLKSKGVVDVVTTHKTLGSLIYFSGTKGGQPVSGIYDLTTNQLVFSVKDSFSSISFLI